jgi:hypothetical protein
MQACMRLDDISYMSMDRSWFQHRNSRRLLTLESQPLISGITRNLPRECWLLMWRFQISTSTLYTIGVSYNFKNERLWKPFGNFLGDVYSEVICRIFSSNQDWIEQLKKITHVGFKTPTRNGRKSNELQSVLCKLNNLLIHNLLNYLLNYNYTLAEHVVTSTAWQESIAEDLAKIPSPCAIDEWDDKHTPLIQSPHWASSSWLIHAATRCGCGDYDGGGRRLERGWKVRKLPS